MPEPETVPLLTNVPALFSRPEFVSVPPELLFSVPPILLFSVPEFVHQNLASMASDTNGQYYRLHTSYTTPLRQIEKQTAGYYLISYYTKKRPGEHGFQKVNVALRNPEFKVSARSGYSYGD